LFQVLHVGVGKASGAVLFNVKTINNCMIRWGKIQSFSQNTVVLNLNSLKPNGENKYKLTILKETVSYNKEITGALKISDTVAVHWGMAIKKLTKIEEKKIKYWTDEVIKLTF